MTHSKLPWTLDKEIRFLITDKNDCYITRVEFRLPHKEELAKEDAEFIVKACNNHHKLVEALQELITLWYGDSEDKYAPTRAFAIKAKALLKEIEK